MGRCAHVTCTRRPSFNDVGSKRPKYCKQHADNRMVDVRNTRCLHGSCPKQPNFNVIGCKTPMYCKQHADDSMVHIYSRRCSHDFCTKRPSFNFVGMKPLYCKKHADDRMVDVHNRRCSDESCERRAVVNVASSKNPMYCVQHAKNGMVNVNRKLCSHGSCSGWPRWGVLDDLAASVCAFHKTILTAGLVIDFKQKCEIWGCRRVARWGLAATQPTHCAGHGPLHDGFSRFGGARRKGNRSSRSSSHVKAECLY